MTLPAVDPPAALSRAGRRRVPTTLSMTVTSSYGVLYSALPVVAPSISRTTGWSATGVVGAFSVGLLLAAAAGVPVGRHIDEHGPGAIMTAGSALAATAVVGVAVAPTFAWFVVAWSVAGIAMGAVLYAPAFVTLTRWYGPRRVPALTVLTLAAGLHRVTCGSGRRGR